MSEKLIKRITIRVTESLHRAVKARVAREGLTLQTAITALLREWLEEEIKMRTHNDSKCSICGRQSTEHLFNGTNLCREHAMSWASFYDKYKSEYDSIDVALKAWLDKESNLGNDEPDQDALRGRPSENRR